MPDFQSHLIDTRRRTYVTARPRSAVSSPLHERAHLDHATTRAAEIGEARSIASVKILGLVEQIPVGGLS
jgi:hypothetical protein